MAKTNKFSKILDKILTVILIIFVVVMVGSSIFFTYSKAQNKMVSIFGYSICYVVTGSMLPALEVGDVILIKDVDVQEIKLNDIITYQSTYGTTSGQYITHRIVEVHDEGSIIYFRAKGDANTGNDTELITEDKIRGVYQNKIGVVKFLISALSNPIIFALIIAVPLVIFLIMQLIDFLKTLKMKEDDK